MFFKRNENTVNDGDRRTITKFCWLPFYAIDGWFWLEEITVIQEARNMYFEASEWVEWKVIEVI